MKIRTEHDIFEGTPKQIVAQLNATSRAHAATNARWMEEAADRATMVTGTDVRFDTALHFLHDLAKTGQIDILEDEKAK
jgi:hypothetical protein